MQRNRMLRKLMFLNVAVVLACAPAMTKKPAARMWPSVIDYHNWGNGADYPNNRLSPVRDGYGKKEKCAVVQIVKYEGVGDDNGDTPPDLDADLIEESFGDVHIEGKPLLAKVWRHVSRDLKILKPACSGVVFESNSKILTAAHCADSLMEKKGDALYVIFGRTENADADGDEYHPYRVKAASRYLRNEHVDIMVLDLAESIDDACPKQVASEPVKRGDHVFAQFHPFGLPQMRSSRALVTKCGETWCAARLDNGSGGSGGLITNAKGDLVGVVRGNVDHRLHGNYYGLPPRPQPFTRASILCETSHNIGQPQWLDLINPASKENDCEGTVENQE